MISETQLLSSLVFLTVNYISISILFRERHDIKVNIGAKRNMLWIGIGLAILFIGLKLSYDLKDSNKNYYQVLQTGRHSTNLEIRKAYKKLSKIHHPDKSNQANSEEIFYQIKIAYDVLMDESQRDSYNRFGENGLNFDPRKDEMKLISDLSLNYIFWIIVSYVMTLPYGARASRTWIAIFGILVLSIEVCFCLTETEIPLWMPSYLTEFGLIYFLHGLFPGVIVLLRCLAEYLYVDVNQTVVLVLDQVTDHQKSLVDMIRSLEHLMETNLTKGSDAAMSSIDKPSVEVVKDKLIHLRQQMESASESTSMQIDYLKNSKSNPGANYYWIIFVLLYGGVYFLN